ncbi:MAG: DNA gyrase inhibitor YacG [Isosphaeraceae bacterium]|nr:DNA gyrase inhibitor YacG [Isosphaeraceae bacterium]
MIRGRCPICSKTYEIQALADLPTFPFCCERCRLIDLGRWIDGNYAIPGGPESTEKEEELSADDAD